MPQYLITQPFTYTSKSGQLRDVNPQFMTDNGSKIMVIDTDDPKWDFPDNFQPPPAFEPVGPR